MKYFSIKKVEDFSTAFLLSKGVPENDARYIAKMAVKTEAMGITTHGLSVLGYLDKQIPDPIDPELKPEIINDRGAIVLLDGNKGFSQLALKMAIEISVQKAGKMGIAMAAIRNVSWIGALGPYIESIAREGFMVQLWGHSSQCSDCAPVGGIIGKFSTNPVALAFPANGNPVVADISTSTVSMGAVGRMVKNNEKARAKIFMDKEGNATDDPNAVMDDGSIFFLGGPKYAHKGYGLSLWAEALTAMAGGTCNNPLLDQSQNLNLTVIDIDAFGGNKYFQNEITRFISHVKDNKLRPGYSEIRLPGERAFESLAYAREHGLSLDSGKLEMLNAIAGQNGIKPLE